jgi:hypothetical protein
LKAARLARDGVDACKEGFIFQQSLCRLVLIERRLSLPGPLQDEPAYLMSARTGADEAVTTGLVLNRREGRLRLVETSVRGRHASFGKRGFELASQSRRTARCEVVCIDAQARGELTECRRGRLATAGLDHADVRVVVSGLRKLALGQPAL